VIVEFNSYDIALAAHENEAYKKALQALGSGAEGDYRKIRARGFRLPKQLNADLCKGLATDHREHCGAMPRAKLMHGMPDLELRRFGERARTLSDPKMNFGATEPHAVELEEARAEWRRWNIAGKRLTYQELTGKGTDSVHQ